MPNMQKNPTSKAEADTARADLPLYFEPTGHPLTPAARADDLALCRERLAALALDYPVANAKVAVAAAEAERARVEVDLRPGDQVARDAAEHAARMLDAAISERDAISEAIERLRRHESTLAAEVAAAASAELVAAQAAARAANTEAIRDGAAAVRAWVGRIILDSELQGRRVADVGRLIAEYLTGKYVHSLVEASAYQHGIDLAQGEAWRMRGQLERGEVVK